MRLLHWLDRFCENHEYGVSRCTRDHYRFAVRSLERFLGRAAMLSDLVDSTISSWIDGLRATRSPHTARTQRAAILTLWNAAWREEAIPLPPRRVRRLRTPEPRPDAWTLDQVIVLANAAAVLPGTVRRRRIRIGPHAEAFVRCSWDTAFRLGDLLSLTACSVTRDGLVDVIQHKTLRRQVVRLWPETMAAIRDTMADEPRERLFPLGARWYQVRIRNLARSLGLRGSVKWLRRSVATAAEVSGGYGSQMLGHADPRTARWYIDQSQLEAVVAPRLGKATVGVLTCRQMNT